jgi:prepilin-type N-terminal cleavage/methylation domain-containing protein
MKIRRNAFTLIELLIVVAIIAILAAIAVPNFLEAQTRAKVSRVKSDQRSMATAIESYTVDWNRPPWQTLDMGLPNGFFWRPLISLSSPISYLSNSFLRDPFGSEDTGFFPGNPEIPIYLYVNYVALIEVGDTVLGGAEILFTSLLGMTQFDANQAVAELKARRWLLTSPGPVRKYFLVACTDQGTGLLECVLQNAVLIVNDDFIYDPTNGTISPGEIRRDGFGIPGQQ